MKLIISNQDDNSLRIVRVKHRQDEYTVNIQNERKPGADNSFMKHIETFKCQGRLCLVIGRRSGLIQLYESALDGKISLALRKEWKHACLNNQDSLVALKVVAKRFLITCSSDGKLVVRDLVNDDDNNTYRAFTIQGPVSCIEVKYSEHLEKLIVASAGKNNELRLYDIGLFSKFRTSSLGNISPPVLGTRSLRRQITSLDLGESHYRDRNTKSLLPFWTSQSFYQDYIYNSSSFESISNWIMCICFQKSFNQETILCGTHFGNILAYDSQENKHPLEELHVSQFAITNLKVFKNNRLLVFSDAMSRIGIIDLKRFEILCLYDNLRFGPTCSLEIYTPPDEQVGRKHRDESRFDPIYVATSNVDMHWKMYALYDNETYDLLLDVKTESIMSCFHILGDYNALVCLVENNRESLNLIDAEDKPLAKRRKLDITFLSHRSRISTINESEIDPHDVGTICRPAHHHDSSYRDRKFK